MDVTLQRYQLLVLGPGVEPRLRDEVVELLSAAFDDLGLASTEHLEVLEGSDAAADWEHLGAVAALWFGRKDGSELPDEPGELEVLGQLLESGVLVLPVVESLKRYPDRVPKQLWPINGMTFDAARIVQSLLTAFRLSRKQRQAFISYRRAESRAVAVQLFHRLTDAGYQTFLDTASVAEGVDFQEVLMERLTDADLLVFLETETALDSDWVLQEVTRAQELAMGVLAVTWPEVEPGRDTGLVSRVSLAEGSFEPSSGEMRELTSETLDKIARAAEEARIFSLGSRRKRLQEQVLEQVELLAGGAGVSWAVVLPDRILVQHEGAEFPVLPVVGLPTARQVHELEQAQEDPLGKECYVVFDRFGLAATTDQYIEWLDRHLVPQLCSVQRLGAQLGVP